MAIDVLKAGFLTTIQDEGRLTMQQYGMPVSGAMDILSLRIANMLLQQGNEAALEMTVVGPILQFTKETMIALTGANFQPLLNGQPCPMWRPVRVQAGDVLKLPHAKEGARGYLAIKGGFTLKPQFASHSTYLPAEIGGYQGRALKQGDVLPFRQHKASFTPNWQVNASSFLSFQQVQIIRIVEGIDMHLLAPESKVRLTEIDFSVSNQSDRMGYRLQLEQPLQLQKPANLLSEAVTFGTVQLPPSGEPIILMADRQTIGGYPKIAQVAAVDLPRLAQLKPGATIRFSIISLEEAQNLYFEREKALRLLEILIRQK